jgi:arsenate reductase
VDDLAGEQFDLVITVCDQAQQQCPIFPGETQVMHVGRQNWLSGLKNSS